MRFRALFPLKKISKCFNHSSNSHLFCRSSSSSDPMLQRSTGRYNELLHSALASLVGSEHISQAVSVREHHSHDESHHSACLPDAVLFPSALEQVIEIAKLCNSFRVPLIPFGTGTGLEGGVVATKGGVCVDMSQMNSIVEVQKEDFYATVQPGVTRLTLNSYLRDTGLLFPVDPGVDASLCGMVATGASGTNAVKYGTMRENVLNLQVVLADGRVVHTAGLKGRARKSSAGYNLTQLFVGSEGTLGLITQATLKLHGIPEATVAAVCPFPSLRAAVDTTVDMLAAGIPVGRIELLDEMSIAASNAYSKLNLPVVPTLFLEFSGSAASVEEHRQTAGTLARDNGCMEFVWESEEEARNKIWKARHELGYALMATCIGKLGITTDVCVPISKLSEVLIETKQDLEISGLRAPILGHVGDGNFHTFIIYEPANRDQLRIAQELATRMAKRAVCVGGTCTGEHGIGLGKRELLKEEFGETGLALMKQIKRTLDPNNVMNPSKVL